MREDRAIRRGATEVKMEGREGVLKGGKVTEDETPSMFAITTTTMRVKASITSFVELNGGRC